MSLKGKILILSAFMCMLSATIGGVSYYFSSKTTKAFEEVVSADIPAVRALDQMLLCYRLARIELLQIIQSETDDQADAASQKVIEAQWKAFDVATKEYLDSSAHAGSEEKAAFTDFKKNMEAVRVIFDKALAIAKTRPAEGSKEFKEMYKLAVINLAEYSVAVRTSSKVMTDTQSAKIENHSKAAFEAVGHGNLFMALTTVIGSLVGFAFAWLFSTSISRQVGTIIQHISESSEQVASASTLIASSSQELSQASTEQAASLQETAAALEEISAMISKASESANTTERSSSESQQKAEQGRKAVEQMMTSMNEISSGNEDIITQVNHSNQQMTEIVRVIQEIGTKTKVINEIVFQTKLLSFNASVEAARAGEHGKGFAVVAEEVGNLAQMSGNAAKEITEMLDSSISKVELIVRDSKSKIEVLVASGKQRVELGVDVARQCSSALDEIVHNVTRVTGLSQEISHASKEQAQGVAEINKAMNQLDSVTQQNSATSEQAASSAEELAVQADLLKTAIGELVIAVQGGASQAEPPHQPMVTPAIMRSPKRVNNVVKLKAKKAIPPLQHKVASGDGLAPSRDSDGFGES